MNILKTNYSSENPYQSGLTRRDALKWMGALSLGAALPAISGSKTTIATKSKGNWPQLKLPAITAKGYGKDPILLTPNQQFWPLSLTTAQLTLVAVISDIIVPSEGVVPSATQVKVPDVIDEWVSAPYERQQADRIEILNLLAWFDDESARRFNRLFVDISAAKQLMIIDDIAFKKAKLVDEFIHAANAFSRLRQLVLAAFFCSPEGTKDIGYLGNRPVAGDYPGPTKEAMNHLDQILDELGLSL
ncbi:MULTISPECIES: gluconate 2-dehydrogenase subunit 3 family protein [unclassified Pseudoalteromonas]|uniref:gluconate 2-dehydrogenase subunit 3 family protein n=1 Tax=unclassified Pseudoalteromonas TaxID=194690 RepID=UPI0005AB057B|nr:MULTISPECIES: gluconate 2-dehydrogenase subunit 3 family protein [unclassified Pseudoalteromonas]